MDKPGTAESTIVLQGDSRTFNLAFASLAAQLPGEFGDLGDAGAHRLVIERKVLVLAGSCGPNPMPFPSRPVATTLRFILLGA